MVAEKAGHDACFRLFYDRRNLKRKRQIARLTKDLVLCHTLRNLKNL